MRVAVAAAVVVMEGMQGCYSRKRYVSVYVYVWYERMVCSKLVCVCMCV